MLIDATLPTCSVFTLSEVGDKIVRRLRELDMTQRELAAAMDVHEQTVSNLVRGVQLPRQRRVQVALADVLGGEPADWAPSDGDLLELARRRVERLRRRADGR